MWSHYKVEQTECAKQAGTRAGVWSQWRHHLESLGQSGEHTTTKSNLSRHLLNLKVLPTSKALKLYTIMSLTSMTSCFALMLKRKLNKCMMKCDDHLRRFNETLTNWHWISTIKIHAFVANDYAWHVQTIKNEPYFLSKNLRTEPGCVLKQEITVYNLST